MVSRFSQPPVAYWKKLAHAFTVVSIIAGSTTLSGWSCVAGACACSDAAASADAASSATASGRRRLGTGLGMDDSGRGAAGGMGTAERSPRPGAGQRDWDESQEPSNPASGILREA